MKDLYCRVERFKNNHKGSKAENIVIHVCTNHFQRENLRDSSRKICKLLQKVKYDIKDGVVYFSGILPKFRSVVFESIDYIYVQQLMVFISSIITRLHLIIN